MDKWSVAQIITEILVGTELALPMLSFHWVEEMLDILEQYLDPGTYLLLQHLYTADDRIDVDKYVKDHLSKEPTLIADNIRKVDLALQ